MKAARKPADEPQRLESLNNLRLLDTPIEERFERITRLLCRSLDVPMAAFTLVDKERQWFKSAQGISGTETPRGQAFCAHTILEDEMLLVPDATKDERFSGNPLVTGDMAISFYAGCPVRSPDGSKVGALCAIDTKPRELDEDAQQMLRDLTTLLENELKALSLSKMHVELQAELDEAQRMSLVDSLTRLWNRTGIFNFFKRGWSEAVRKKTAVGVVMADIDHFKNVNDKHGHPAGDAVLQAVARKLLSALRTEDAVGRIGGEEFLIVLTGNSVSALKQTVDRIRNLVAASAIPIDEGKLFVTMSFGAIAATGDKSVSMDSLIKLADEALYKAKKNGRNRVEIAQMPT